MSTDQYAVIGYPVKQSRSPVIHTVFARQTGQDLKYTAIEVRPDKLESDIGQFFRDGYLGLNVTVPHKSEVTRLADGLSDHAATAGAVNTLSLRGDRIFGDNTDGVGLIRDLTHNLGWPLSRKRVLILGAGGATRGIVRPLFESGVAEIVIANRSVAKAVGLAAHFSSFGETQSARFSELDRMQSFDLIINATSAGLDGERPVFPDAIIHPDCSCYDLSYGASSTPFLSWARGLGAGNCSDGFGMLVEQAAESFRLWRDVMPNTSDVISRFSGRS